MSSALNFDYDLSRPTTRKSKHVKSNQTLYPEHSFEKRSDRIALSSNSRLREKEASAKEFLQKIKDKNSGEIARKNDYSQSLKGDPLFRSLYREQADDDALLGSVSSYLESERAKEIECEELFGFNEPIGRISKKFEKTGSRREKEELFDDSDHKRRLEFDKHYASAETEEKPFEWHRVKVPDRNLAGTSLAELNARRDELTKRTPKFEGRTTNAGYVTTEEDEMLKKVIPGMSDYDNGPDFSSFKNSKVRDIEQKYGLDYKNNPYLQDLTDSDENDSKDKAQTCKECGQSIKHLADKVLNHPDTTNSTNNGASSLKASNSNYNSVAGFRERRELRQKEMQRKIDEAVHGEYGKPLVDKTEGEFGGHQRVDIGGTSMELDFSDEEVLALLNPKPKSRVKRYDDRMARMRIPDEEPDYMASVRKSKKKDFDMDDLDDEINRMRSEMW